MKSKKDKRKKMKKKEQVLVVRAKSIQDCPSKESEGSSRECSIQSQQDPDSVRTLHQIEQVCSQHCTIHSALIFFIVNVIDFINFI